LVGSAPELEAAFKPAMRVSQASSSLLMRIQHGANLKTAGRLPDGIHASKMQLDEVKHEATSVLCRHPVFTSSSCILLAWIPSGNRPAVFFTHAEEGCRRLTRVKYTSCCFPRTEKPACEKRSMTSVLCRHPVFTSSSCILLAWIPSGNRPAVFKLAPLLMRIQHGANLKTAGRLPDGIHASKMQLDEVKTGVYFTRVSRLHPSSACVKEERDSRTKGKGKGNSRSFCLH
jgi:protein-S-isoprenylcysteine O-methyltransferase Ste14